MANTKERILESSSELFRRQGYSATGLKQIVDAANAPFGSIYHFFPGGKAQLGEKVIRSSGALYGELIDFFFGREPDPVKATEAFFQGAAQTLRDTDYADACPIATVALEVASTNERLRLVTGAIFEGWTEMLATRLRSAGLDAVPAREIALTYLAALEGGFLLCRAAKSTEAMDAVGRFVADRVDAALAEADSR